MAIKYNPWFGDAFYNSSKFGMTIYLMRVFTSWAIVAEVYYLPLMIRGTNEENGEKEDSIEFANRCKAAIAEAGGLVDRNWDGNLKVNSDILLIVNVLFIIIFINYDNNKNQLAITCQNRRRATHAITLHGNLADCRGEIRV